MTPVSTKRGSLETDVHTRRTPREDEGRALQDEECQRRPERRQQLGEAGVRVPSALRRSQPCGHLTLDSQSDWEIVQHISVPQVGVLFTAVSAN